MVGARGDAVVTAEPAGQVWLVGEAGPGRRGCRRDTCLEKCACIASTGAASMRQYCAQAAGMARGAGEAIFAVARAAGWIAHALEAYESGTILRPHASYTGPAVRPS
jgi:Citrate synthase, C-terminal domain